MSARERFGHNELGVTGAEASEVTAIARRLERYADGVATPAADDLPDLVMSLIAAEPVPAPVRALRAAARAGRIRAAMTALVDAWRVAVSGGRPIAARASAFALIAILLLATASVGGGAAVGAWNALNPDRPSIVSSPSPLPSPTVVTPSPPPTATPSSTEHESESDDASGDSGDHDGDSPTPG